MAQLQVVLVAAVRITLTCGFIRAFNHPMIILSSNALIWSFPYPTNVGFAYVCGMRAIKQKWGWFDFWLLFTEIMMITAKRCADRLFERQRIYVLVSRSRSRWEMMMIWLDRWIHHQPLDNCVVCRPIVTTRTVACWVLNRKWNEMDSSGPLVCIYAIIIPTLFLASSL